MNIQMLIDLFSNQISSLQRDLDISKSHKEVLEIIQVIMRLENIDDSVKVNWLPVNLEISREGMYEFIELLNSNEYLKEYSNGGRNYDSNRGEITNFEHHYLKLNKGYILDLSLIEREFFGYEELGYGDIKKSCLWVAESDLINQTESVETLLPISTNELLKRFHEKLQNELQNSEPIKTR